MLRAAGIEESDAASLKSTYLETLGQALSGIAAAMGGRAGHEVTCTGGEESSSQRRCAMGCAATSTLARKRRISPSGIERRW